MGQAKDAGTLAGLIEQHARLAGAEETYIAVAPDLAADRRLNRTSQPTPLQDRFAVRASIAYKGCWIRRTRTFATRRRGEGRCLVRRRRAFDRTGPTDRGATRGEAEELPGAALISWIAESCTGSYPLSAVASSRAPGQDAMANGQFLVLTVELTLDGAPWIGAVPMVVGQPSL